MTKRSGLKARFKSGQQGAVAIIVALSLVVLIGMLGLVLDLGHLYVTKTELQNAADAAALSGAKELNGNVSGINNAINRSIETAGRNKYNLNSETLVITSANIRVGACPSAGCMVPITSITTNALAADKTFLEVDTGSKSMSTWFAQVLSNVGTNMATVGVAVAGKYEANITPIAICRMPDPGTTNEFGYERGVTYKISDSNPVGAGAMYWIDPESNIPNDCKVTSADATRPYLCTGKTGFTPVVGQSVNTNTGISNSQLESMDSRFDSYGSQGKCDPSTAPPDTNVKEYRYEDVANGSPSRWMGTDPASQSITAVDKNDNTAPYDACKKNSPCKAMPYGARTAADYGVLWSRYRPVGKAVTDWSTLYAGNTATSYPEPSPYEQTSGEFYQAPSVSHPGVPGRRTLNMVIVDCSAVGGNCRPATVLGVGRFFMQRKSNTVNEIFVEFGGLLPTPLPTSDIKLYR